VKKTLLCFILLTVWVPVLWAQTPAPAPSWKSLEDFWGAPGWQENGIEVLGFPRADLNVMVEGVPLENAMGLTSRFRFKALSKGLAVHGQLVLLDQESRRVQNRLILDGFKMESFGDFLVGETPGVKLLEFSGKGTQSILNAQLKELLKLTGTPLKPLSFSSPAPEASQNWDSLQKSLGQKGFVQGKVLWILAPAFTPTSDPGLGYYSLRFQRDGQSLLVLGEAVVAPAKVQTLMTLLAREKMMVTAWVPGSGAARLRWWGTGAEPDLVPALQKAAALAEETSDEPTAELSPAPAGTEAPEGGF
jgi:hypothetical protein